MKKSPEENAKTRKSEEREPEGEANWRRGRDYPVRLSAPLVPRQLHGGRSFFAFSPFRVFAFSSGLFAIAFLPARVGASSALPGFTGALTTPTAFSQAFQSGDTGVTRYEDQTRVYLNYGAWETGEVTVSTSGTNLLLHAKYTLLPESPHRPALAMGGTGLLGHDPTLYVVAGGSLWVRDGGSLLRVAGGGAAGGGLAPLFASAELRVSRVAGFVIEWSRQLNFGLRLDPTAQFRLLIGVTHHQAGLGVSYDIGL